MSQYSRPLKYKRKNPIKRIKLLLHVNFENQPLYTGFQHNNSCAIHTIHLWNKTRYICFSKHSKTYICYSSYLSIVQCKYYFLCPSVEKQFYYTIDSSALRNTSDFSGISDLVQLLHVGQEQRRRPSRYSVLWRKSQRSTVLLRFFFRLAKVAVDF